MTVKIAAFASFAFAALMLVLVYQYVAIREQYMVPGISPVIGLIGDRGALVAAAAAAIAFGFYALAKRKK
jgi:hypothetical protein